jgi:hypothetical protein
MHYCDIILSKKDAKAINPNIRIMEKPTFEIDGKFYAVKFRNRVDSIAELVDILNDKSKMFYFMHEEHSHAYIGCDQYGSMTPRYYLNYANIN